MWASCQPPAHLVPPLCAAVAVAIGLPAGRVQAPGGHHAALAHRRKALAAGRKPHGRRLAPVSEPAQGPRRRGRERVDGGMRGAQRPTPPRLQPPGHASGRCGPPVPPAPGRRGRGFEAAAEGQQAAEGACNVGKLRARHCTRGMAERACLMDGPTAAQLPGQATLGWALQRGSGEQLSRHAAAAAHPACKWPARAAPQTATGAAARWCSLSDTCGGMQAAARVGKATARSWCASLAVEVKRFGTPHPAPLTAASVGEPPSWRCGRWMPPPGRCVARRGRPRPQRPPHRTLHDMGQSGRQGSGGGAGRHARLRCSPCPTAASSRTRGAGAVVPGWILLPSGLIEQLAQQAAEHAAPLLLLLLQQCRGGGRGRVWHFVQRRQRLRGRREGAGARVSAQPEPRAVATAHGSRCMRLRLTSGGTTCSCPSTSPMRCDATTTGRPSTSVQTREA